MTAKWIAGAVLMTAIGSLAQAPAAPAGQAPAGQAPGGRGSGGRGGGNRGRLAMTTDGFEDGAVIPIKYSAAAEGGAVSPKLTWTGAPDGVVSYTLILHDPDTSMMKGTAQYLHWLIFNIPGTTTELPEGVATTPILPDGSIQLMNSGRKPGYAGMGAGPGPYHHYTFEMYALDTKLTLGADATQDDVMKAMDGHVMGKATLVGRYHRLP